MSAATAPIVFKSTDTGAASLTGQVGALLTILNESLIIKRLFTAISGASFVDNSAEARLEGGTTFKLFQGPTVTNDEAYFGLCNKFGRIKLDFGTPGVHNAAVTLAWEYWNGSAWTALSGVSDGTSVLTANGTVTFTIPGDWATTAVNSITVFWVRVRFTAGSWTTNPLVNTATITGWTQPFTPASNVCAYHMGGGNAFYVNVDDNAVGAGGAKEARVTGFETMSALSTGTGDFPTAAQLAVRIVWRKSNTADGTARVWYLVADDRTLHLFMFTGDVGSVCWYASFGDFFSFVTADSYRTIILGRNAENNATQTPEGSCLLAALNVNCIANYVARAYTGAGSSLQVGKHGDGVKGSTTQSTGSVTYPNAPDSGLYLSPIWIHEGNNVRGQLRMLYQFLHALASVNDLDTFSGAGAYAGKSFLAVKQLFNAGAGAGSVGILETSDTIPTN